MENLQLLGGLALAIILGSIVGLEREANNHPAGLRTHALVCVGSALVTMVSWQAFISFNQGDPTRISAQIISGIGFLGAGTIMREGANIKGLTTAASLWTVAAIGLAVGYGYYFIAISTTMLTVIVLHMFHNWWEKIFAFTKQHLRIKIIVEDRPGMIGKIGNALGKLKIDIKNISMESHDNDTIIILELKLPQKLSYDTIADKLYDIDGVTKLEYQD